MSVSQFLRSGKLLMLLLSALFFFNQSLIAQPDKHVEVVKSLFEDQTVSLPDEYSFFKAIRMKLENTNPSKQTKSEMVYTMRYAREGSYIALFPELINNLPPPAESIVLVDFDTQRMVTFMPTLNQKMAMIYQLPSQTPEELAKMKQTSFEATGKEKLIAGYLCKEYLITGSTVEGVVWLNTDLDINFQKSFQALGLKFEIGDTGSSAPKGFIMEFATLPIAGGESSRMEVLAVDLNDPYTISTSNYTLTTMPLVTDEE